MTNPLSSETLRPIETLEIENDLSLVPRMKLLLTIHCADHSVKPLDEINHSESLSGLIKTIVGVVEACHSLGVMHRDLKPENFLLDTPDEGTKLKATDFGLSIFYKPGLKRADIDNSGTIDYGEFIAATLHINKMDREENLIAAFSFFDKDGSGYITIDELQQACRDFGLGDVQLDDTVTEIDQDNIGGWQYIVFPGRYIYTQRFKDANVNDKLMVGVNVTVGETEERMMTTGLHTVADIFCVGCGSIVGWKYETAHEKGQKYKEGKSVLERIRFQAPMEATTGPAMKHMWAEVMQMMFDYAFVPICAFLIPQFPLFDLWIAELAVSRRATFHETIRDYEQAAIMQRAHLKMDDRQSKTALEEGKLEDAVSCRAKVTGEGDDKYLIATAEQPLCAYHLDDWIHPSQLPNKVTRCNLRWNKLQDVIPPEIGELKSLTHLYLSFNNFKGEISKELANLPLLRYLYLHENRFIGRIPPELGTLQQLGHLYLDHNQFTGRIPDAFYKHTFLKEMYIEGNAFWPGVNPIGVHNVLEVFDIEFLF
ncbi:unnamed protein product [Camellia sinensis]